MIENIIRKINFTPDNIYRITWSTCGEEMQRRLISVGGELICTKWCLVTEETAIGAVAQNDFNPAFALAVVYIILSTPRF